MIRHTWLMLALALCLASCTPDFQRRVIVPAPIEFGPVAQGDQLALLRKAYISEDGQKALFFVGDGQAMSVHLIDKTGLMLTDQIPAPQDREAVSEAEQEAVNAAEAALDSLFLPAGSFAVIPAQQGLLAYYRQGKLSMVAYLADQNGALRIGAATDMGLLTKLIAAEGGSSSMSVLPAVWDGVSAKNMHLVLFEDAPLGLGTVLTSNTRALFHEVLEDKSGRGWVPSGLPAPTGLSDSAAIEALRQKVAEAG